MSSDWNLDEVGFSWLIFLLVEVQETLDGIVELLVKLGLLGWDLGNIQVSVINWNLFYKKINLEIVQRIFLSTKFNWFCSFVFTI